MIRRVVFLSTVLAASCLAASQLWPLLPTLQGVRLERAPTTSPSNERWRSGPSYLTAEPFRQEAQDASPALETAADDHPLPIPRLVGVGRNSGRQVAVLRDQGGELSRGLVGDVIFGWQIASITQNRVMLHDEDQGRSVELELFRGED